MIAGMIRKIIEFCEEETKKHSFIKFLLLLLVFVIYSSFTFLNEGLKNGFLVSIISWSFFVLCTPVADAGFLLDFPVRVISGFRMVYSEIIVWFIAIFVNILSLTFFPQIYSKTILLYLLYYIITQPFPYWGIIILSGIGTFFSVYFGDELIDVSFHNQRKKFHKHLTKHKIVIFVFVISLIIVLYTFLIEKLGVKIPL